MTDLQELEQALTAHGGEVTGDALPPDFREKMDALRAAGDGSSVVITERQLHIETATRLLGQLDDADNLVVKSQKRRIVHAELNAVRFLDGL